MEEGAKNKGKGVKKDREGGVKRQTIRCKKDRQDSAKMAGKIVCKRI